MQETRVDIGSVAGIHPCPWCANTATLIASGVGDVAEFVRVECGMCRAGGPLCGSSGGRDDMIARAVQTWNMVGSEHRIDSEAEFLSLVYGAGADDAAKPLIDGRWEDERLASAQPKEA